jgi:hypothetical protein
VKFDIVFCSIKPTENSALTIFCCKASFYPLPMDKYSSFYLLVLDKTYAVADKRIRNQGHSYLGMVA